MDYEKIFNIEKEVKLLNAKEKFTKRELIKKKTALIASSFTKNNDRTERLVGEVKLLEKELKIIEEERMKKNLEYSDAARVSG